MTAEQGVELMSAEQGVEPVSAEQWVESRWWDGEVKRYQAGLLVACLSQFSSHPFSPQDQWKKHKLKPILAMSEGLVEATADWPPEDCWGCC